MIDLNALHKKREELVRYFTEQSSKTGLPIVLSDVPESKYDLLERLLDSKLGNRWFIIEASDNLAYVNGFTKKAGLNFEINMLYLFWPINCEDSFEFAWNLYVDWIHNKIDPEVAQRKVDDLQVK